MADGGETAARVVAVRDECVREVMEYLLEVIGPTRHAHAHAVAIVDMVILRASTLHS